MESDCFPSILDLLGMRYAIMINQQLVGAMLPLGTAHYALEYSPQPTLVLDSARTIIYANPAALTLAQASAAHIIGQLFTALLDEGSVRKGEALLVAAQRGATQMYELNQISEAGKVMMIGYRAVPLPNAAEQTGDAAMLLFGQPMAQTVATTERLLALNRRHHALYTIAAAASRALVLNELLQHTLDVTLTELDLQAGLVLLADEAATSNGSMMNSDAAFQLVAQHGFAASFATHFAVEPRFFAAHRTKLQRGESLVLHSDASELGITSDDLTIPLGPLLNLAIVPLLSERQIQGWLLVLTDRYRAFNVSEAETLGTIGNLLGPVIANVHQVTEMNRLKDEFVAAAAHDLKTPVTAIKGYTQMALRLVQRQDVARLVPQLEMINARSSELTHLMESLLDVSRIQAGRLGLDVEQFNVRDLVTDVLAYFAFDLQRQHRELTLGLPDAPLIVEWDRVRVTRVLINLVSNAIKYSSNGTSIQLQVRQADDQERVELNVTDHGIGIPLAERKRVFERFYRVKYVVNHGFKGTGLGLYIAAQVVAAHDGRVWADNATHGGQGTTLHVALPRCVPTQTTGEHQLHETRNTPTHGA